MKRVDPLGGEPALDRLRRGEPMFGMAQILPAPTITDLALWMGFDFVMLDCQHGVADESGHLACIEVIEQASAFSAVRVRPGDYGAVGRYLDFGADLILMADIRSAQDASRFVAAATPGPGGTRSSTSLTRASRYGLGEPKLPLLVALIEGAEAVQDLEAIAATQGLDGLMIGPSDMSADLQCSDDFANPVYRRHFEAVEQVATERGLILGTRPHQGYEISRLVNGGHRLILLGSDIGALRKGFDADFRGAMAALGGAAP